jgi:hypothetical protein
VTPKSVHKDADSLARFFFDQDEAAIVAVRLAGDPDFQAKAQVVASETSAKRRKDAAVRESKSYAPYQSAGRNFIVDLLLLMAAGPRFKGQPLVDFVANELRPAVWCESAALGDLDPQRVRPRWSTLSRGADFVARFGAFNCLECEQPFAQADRYEHGSSHRRSRRVHCDACKTRLKPAASASQVDEMKRALEAATGQRREQRATRRGRG